MEKIDCRADKDIQSSNAKYIVFVLGHKESAKYKLANQIISKNNQER